jgi:hypothetical protein
MPDRPEECSALGTTICNNPVGPASRPSSEFSWSPDRIGLPRCFFGRSRRQVHFWERILLKSRAKKSIPVRTENRKVEMPNQAKRGAQALHKEGQIQEVGGSPPNGGGQDGGITPPGVLEVLQAENAELRSRLAEAEQHRHFLIQTLHRLTAGGAIPGGTGGTDGGGTKP